MKNKRIFLYFGTAFVLTVAAAMNAAAQDAGAAALKPGLYEGGNFIGERTLGQAVEYVTGSARDGAQYTIVLNRDEKPGTLTLKSGGKQVRVTLTTSGGKHTVTGGFSVGKGVVFTLETGVTLSGKDAQSSGSLVRIEGGEFIMNGGAISGNSGNGVYVNGGGFTMNGGIISGNSGEGVEVNGDSFTMSGGEISGNSSGGIYVWSGSFTMSGGVISGNSARYGGGVYVYEGGFTMSGGAINGNSAEKNGGGVCVVRNGSFTMNGGEIGGNTAGGSGGGIRVSKSDNFTKSKTAGIIYGSNGPKGKTNMAASNEKGHAVYVEGASPRIRNSTADETTALDGAKNRHEGSGWETPTDTPAASSLAAGTMQVTTDVNKLKFIREEGRYETLGLRYQPDTTARVIGRLSRGDRVAILQEGAAATVEGMRSNWVQVEVLSGAPTGQKGWLCKGYLDE